MGRIEICATLVIVVGIVLTTTANGGQDPATLTPCQILARYTSPDVAAPMILLLLGIIVIVVALHYNRIRPRLQPVAYAFIAGFMGAILNIMLKIVGTFTQGALAGDPESVAIWSTIHPYYTILAVAVLAVGQISFINQGLERFPAAVFLPTYNCIFTTAATLAGADFFEEFASFGTRAYVMFVLGISTTIGGIALISCSPGENKVRGEEEWEGEMEQFASGQRIDHNGEPHGRQRGPSDPVEPNYFDADLNWDDEKAFANAPALSRLVLI